MHTSIQCITQQFHVLARKWSVREKVAFVRAKRKWRALIGRYSQINFGGSTKYGSNLSQIICRMQRQCFKEQLNYENSNLKAVLGLKPGNSCRNL